MNHSLPSARLAAGTFPSPSNAASDYFTAHVPAEVMLGTRHPTARSW